MSIYAPAKSGRILIFTLQKCTIFTIIIMYKGEKHLKGEVR